MKRTNYGFGKELKIGFDDALAKLPEALKSQGFGVLCDIDVQATMKKKLDLDFRRYRIIGACNPPFAHQALTAELEIGLLLPCNVIVYENDAGTATVMAMDPVAALSLVGNSEVTEVAQEVRTRLERVLDAL